MKDKFFIWVGRNRKAIGYSVAGGNILCAASLLLGSQDPNGWAYLMLGSFIAFDTATTP